MLQPPDFWVRNRIEASEVLAALLGNPQALAIRPGRDLPRGYEYAIGWALDLMGLGARLRSAAQSGRTGAALRGPAPPGGQLRCHHRGRRRYLRRGSASSLARIPRTGLPVPMTGGPLRPSTRPAVP